jgi:hypothetical protein
MANPRKFPVSVARLHVRVIWLKVQVAKSGNRTQENWLLAADRELEPHAAVRINVGGSIGIDNIEKPSEKVDLKLSFEALSGVKLAIVQGAVKDHMTGEPTGFRERQDLFSAADSIGEEFGRLVRKAAILPENADLDESKELEGVPFEEEKPETKMKLLGKDSVPPLPENAT